MDMKTLNTWTPEKPLSRRIRVTFKGGEPVSAVVVVVKLLGGKLDPCFLASRGLSLTEYCSKPSPKRTAILQNC